MSYMGKYTSLTLHLVIMSQETLCGLLLFKVPRGIVRAQYHRS